MDWADWIEFWPPLTDTTVLFKQNGTQKAKTTQVKAKLITESLIYKTYYIMSTSSAK